MDNLVFILDELNISELVGYFEPWALKIKIETKQNA